MAMTDPEITEIARRLARTIYEEAGVTADSDLPTLKAAVQAIDTAMNATTTQVEAAYPGTVLKSALLQYAKAQAPNLQNGQAGVALAYWALKEVGLL